MSAGTEPDMQGVVLSINYLSAPGPGWPGLMEQVRLTSDGTTAWDRWWRTAPIVQKMT